MMILIKQGPRNTGVNIHTGTCSYDGPHKTRSSKYRCKHTQEHALMMVLIKQGPRNTGVNIHTGTCSYDGPHKTRSS